MNVYPLSNTGLALASVTLVTLGTALPLLLYGVCVLLLKINEGVGVGEGKGVKLNAGRRLDL